MAPLTIERIKAELEPYGISASGELCEAISAYIELLLKWNSKISLTTVTDPVEILRFHFGESLFGASKLSIADGRLADVGSGAGFPGFPLRMLLPRLELFLIEPNLKKATFLAEIARELKLDRVQILRWRMEDLPINYADFRFVTARALGNYDQLLRWSRNRLAHDGKLALWLGARDAERLSKTVDWIWGAPLPVPGSQNRVIIGASPKLA